ncbi:MAG: MBL fold metallo-hydrolase [Bacilli bacterium]|nr:MBL fold metallo-hydrolase [Bacilli bacterium]
MKVEKIVNGFLDENCYIISNNEKECLIVDPGSEGEKIVSFIRMNGYKVIGILITHYHFDHVGELDFVKNAFMIDTVIDYKNKGKISLGGFEFQVIENFGHTMDSASFYFDNNNILFSGDFIFKETIGNYEKNHELDMANSLKVFKYMNENVIIYPGHGDETNVKHELEFNPFLRGL